MSSQSIRKALITKIIEEALDQPHPTTGLRAALRMYEGYEAGRDITVRAKVAARQRFYKARRDRV